MNRPVPPVAVGLRRHPRPRIRPRLLQEGCRQSRFRRAEHRVLRRNPSRRSDPTLVWRIRLDCPDWRSTMRCFRRCSHRTYPQTTSRYWHPPSAKAVRSPPHAELERRPRTGEHRRCCPSQPNSTSRHVRPGWHRGWWRHLAWRVRLRLRNALFRARHRSRAPYPLAASGGRGPFRRDSASAGP